MKRLLLTILRCFLPVLFVTYMASITFFAHAHVINGVTIVHSHPFKKAASHHHSTLELQLVHLLSNFSADGSVSFTSLLFFIPFLLGVLSGAPQYKYFHAPYHGVVALRAPPVVRFS